MRLRLVGQRVLEQAAIPEAITEPRLERVEFAAAAARQCRRRTCSRWLSMTRTASSASSSRTATQVSPSGLTREREQPGRRPAVRTDFEAVAVEQRLDDVGFDLRVGPEDHGEDSVMRHSPARADRRLDLIIIRIIVMSSCWSAPPAKARSSARM